ncbi:hypothetical protein [Silvanigrella aquatica]|uniref:Uncharacterized protein n=1 Tax=Silvanigrella aquatica TaxID=1915309 RepID=A0A1L4D032_9BACT|nr:hypothetical protein [Silvanigrella aquatica]APJ03537.1 hypothetical protein AXG55_06305 [Silvanigrella aquatica]
MFLKEKLIYFKKIICIMTFCSFIFANKAFAGKNLGQYFGEYFHFFNSGEYYTSEEGFEENDINQFLEHQVTMGDYGYIDDHLAFENPNFYDELSLVSSDSNLFVFILGKDDILEFSKNIYSKLMKENPDKSNKTGLDRKVNYITLSELLQNRVKVILSEKVYMSDIYSSLLILPDIESLSYLHTKDLILNQDNLGLFNKILSISRKYIIPSVMYKVYKIDNQMYEKFDRQKKDEFGNNLVNLIKISEELSKKQGNLLKYNDFKSFLDNNIELKMKIFNSIYKSNSNT